MANPENKDLWVNWTRDAISKYVPSDDIEDDDELVDDMTTVATKYADAMVDLFEERFGGRRSRKKKPDDDPEDD